MAATHEVFNQPAPLVDVNLFAGNQPLQAALAFNAPALDTAHLHALGQQVGSADMQTHARLANVFTPQLKSHSRFGHRIDQVEFHPSYHALMAAATAAGLHGTPWGNPHPNPLPPAGEGVNTDNPSGVCDLLPLPLAGEGRGEGAASPHLARAAGFMLFTELEPSILCPISMTYAVTPALQGNPAIYRDWAPQLTSRAYDPALKLWKDKPGVTMGMGMTEKQGGSDVRANTTQAYPVGQGGPGEAYELVGHKYFVSAPMCDAFLVLAQTPAGLSCFLMPRWRPDGSKNAMQVLRLKRKMGNVSNASSETELRGTLAWMVGEEGRGVRTIIEMVAMTRFDCMVGSAAGQRAAVAQALHHCSIRSVFGKVLNRQPLMQNVLADLVLEHEGSLALTMRIARAMDHRDRVHEDLLVRLCTAVGKYWICKRTPNHAYEAMECIGGSGVMEDGLFPRLFRESPVNAIWEGSGNVQCLDVLRAMQKTPEVVGAFFSEVSRAMGANANLDRWVLALQKDFRDLSDLEFRARDMVDRMALAMQAAQLVQHAPSFVADAFCASRLASAGHHNYGTLPRGVDCAAIIERATPA
jgi:putative acyl-CoA dehydrogenase